MRYLGAVRAVCFREDDDLCRGQQTSGGGPRCAKSTKQSLGTTAQRLGDKYLVLPDGLLNEVLRSCFRRHVAAADLRYRVPNLDKLWMRSGEAVTKLQRWTS